MVDKNKEIKVTNRYGGFTVYIIPDMDNLRREFAPGQSKLIRFEELQRLSWLPSGMEILKDNLVMDDPEAVKEIMGDVEPEYYYSKENVIKLMQSGSLDQFLDCLDFAPAGILDMIKDLSVSLPLNDVQKRNAVRDKLGFDVESAIRLREEAKKIDGIEETDKPKRRAAAPTEPTSTKPARRTTPAKYKVVS